jgi:DNA-binding MarR family transcriptional regulator
MVVLHVDAASADRQRVHKYLSHKVTKHVTEYWTMAEIETPPLAEQVCFDLYVASRAVTNAYRPVLRSLGLTYPQFLVLIVLWDEGTRTVRELADALRLDHGTLTPLLRRMEASGFVTRRRAEADERFVEIALTPSGDALRAHATAIHCDMVDALGLDATRMQALQETLRELTASVTR